MDIDKGLLIVLSGPSGVGKGTVCRALRQRNKELHYSVSATTRRPREGETEGVNYFFKSRETFEEMIKRDQLLEWAEYVGNYYGTPRDFVERTLENGRDILLEIEVQGAVQIKRKFPEGIFIFLVPPTLNELRSRICNRGTESESKINNRMEAAKAEIDLMKEYDYVVINDEVNHACDRIQSIVMAEHCRKERQIHKFGKRLKEV